MSTTQQPPTTPRPARLAHVAYQWSSLDGRAFGFGDTIIELGVGLPLSKADVHRTRECIADAASKVHGHPVRVVLLSWMPLAGEEVTSEQS